jgi:hypothetical protein
VRVQRDEGTPGGDQAGSADTPSTPDPGADAPTVPSRWSPADPDVRRPSGASSVRGDDDAVTSAEDAPSDEKTVAAAPAGERPWAETTPLGSWEQPQPEVPGQGGHWVATTAMPPSMAPTAAWPHDGGPDRFPAAAQATESQPAPGPPRAEAWSPRPWAPMDAAAPAAQPQWSQPPGPIQVPPPPGPAAVPVPPMPPPAQWPGAAAPPPQLDPWGRPVDGFAAAAPDQPSYFTPAGVAPPPQPYGAPVPYQGYPPAGYAPYGYARPTEQLATAAMVTSSLGVLFTLGNFVLPGSGLLGIGLAVAALILVSQAKRRFAQSGGAVGGEGMLLPSKIMAIVTIVLNVLGFVLVVVAIGLLAAGGYGSS